MKAACGDDSSDEDIGSDSPVVASISSSNKTRLLYDTGASHHFVPNKECFVTFTKRSRKFKFDQAVGSTSLTHHGTASLRLGNFNLELHHALYSPKSSCVILSAGRLERKANIVIDHSNTRLVQRFEGEPDREVARLARKNDVYYVYPLEFNHPKVMPNTITAPIIAPGVARVPRAISAQRWHERLGHIGQKILKKTAECSAGLQNIDLSNLKSCETCHLSKSQRFVSREPRPTPNHPLDEVFMDTVGKLTTAVNGHQYAVIITDAKTRMRWVIATTTKDQISNLLVQWVETQYHQYGKRVRIIFRDGGSLHLRPIHLSRTELQKPQIR